MITSYKKRIFTVITLFFIISAFVVPPQTVHSASAIPVFEVPGLQLGFITEIAFSTGVSAAALTTLTTKESLGDSFAWIAVNLAIQAMTSSIVHWINTGFEGGPSFITDFDDFYFGIAEDVFGIYIQDYGLEFLCDPFQISIEAAISYDHAERANIACTLSGIVDNIDDFLEGDFKQGGWTGWFQLSVYDNPYNRYLDAQRELTRRQEEAKEREDNLLSYGDGFFSKRSCGSTPTQGSDGSSKFKASFCAVVTPGKTIEGQLEKALGLPADKLAIADEINEIMGALLSKLAQEALNGLSGLSANKSGRSSYVNRLSTDRSVEGQAGSNIQGSATNSVAQAIQNEQTYRNALISGLATIPELETLNATLRPVDSTQADSFATSIAARSAFLSAEMSTVGQTLTQLESVRASNASARTITEIGAATQRFILLQSSGQLHADGSAVLIEQGIESLKVQIQTAIDSVTDTTL